MMGSLLKSRLKVSKKLKNYHWALVTKYFWKKAIHFMDVSTSKMSRERKKNRFKLQLTVAGVKSRSLMQKDCLMVFWSKIAVAWMCLILRLLPMVEELKISIHHKTTCAAGSWSPLLKMVNIQASHWKTCLFGMFSLRSLAFRVPPPKHLQATEPRTTDGGSG